MGAFVALMFSYIRGRGTLYPHKLAITSPISGGRSVDTVRSLTHTLEFSLVFLLRGSCATLHDERLLNSCLNPASSVQQRADAKTERHYSG
jgi:hypothetical protein